MSWEDAWAVGPLVDPAPWAETLPEEWLESTVAFIRAMSVDDGHGGFTVDASVTYRVVQAHMEANLQLVTSANAAAATGAVLVQGAIARRTWKGFTDWPDDPTDRPRQGDWVAFTDHEGTARFLKIEQVTDPANIGDHCEFLTQAYE